MNSSLYLEVVKKINLTYLISIVLVLLKTSGGFIFSWFLINSLGDNYHVMLMKDLSSLIGISILIRFGSDAVILKLATISYKEKDRVKLLYLLAFSTILCTVSSIIFYLLASSFLSFETLSVKSGILISFSISFTLCLMSFFKAFERVNYSFLGDTGMIMILALPVLVFIELNTIITLGYLWTIIALISLVYVVYIICKECEMKELDDVKDLASRFLFPLPSLFINSILNYLQQWGVIYLATISLDIRYSSSFILIIRASYIFNAVLSPISSYTIPQVIKNFSEGGSTKVNAYIKKTRFIYNYASLVCLLIASGFSLWSVFPDLFELNYIIAFLFYLICCSFNISSGPVNMYMATLGYEKELIRIRLALLIPSIFALYFFYGNFFIVTCALYILMQRIFLVFFLKKKSGIVAI
ncbi:hypothetical protein AB4150_14600 [Vibrio cyclitrophicus]